MSAKIFVNIPVKDLDRSMHFFDELGFTFNPQFTNKKAACMVVSDDIYVMLLVEPFFKTFTKKEICNAKKSTEAIITLSAESRENVDGLVNRAIHAGASTPNQSQEQEGMYGRGFEDLDGHLWEVIWMDQSQIKKQETKKEPEIVREFL